MHDHIKEWKKMANNHYDVIIIGTGAGGGTLAHQLAPSGKKILVLERGTFVPREKANWDSKEIFQNRRYCTTETWYDPKGKAVHPITHYYVGGNTKFYASALQRFRERDFETVIHEGGISPEWPLKYRDFAPYYTQAEELYEVHGKRGLDPTEPENREEYPFPPASHEPYVQEVHDKLKANFLHPFYVPIGLKLNEVNRHLSPCIRCNTCECFPCLIHAKSDADINCMRPAITHSNLTLLTEAKVLRLHTSASGREVTKVEAEIAGQRQIFSADIIVVACGAINSAVLLLQSANDKHPNGLANSSNLVGRNYMCHNNGVVISLTTKEIPAIFSKTLAIYDFYWGEKDFPYPMGIIHSRGNVDKAVIASYGPPFMPTFMIEALAKRSFSWWIISEDLPNTNNRVYVQDNKITLDYTNNNMKAFDRLMTSWIEILKLIEEHDNFFPLSLHLKHAIGLEGVAHQCGTCVFGEDPKTSVLNLNCRTHDVNNLYVVDGSFFPSSASVNPSLTIIANALRVGDHLLKLLA
jgi:choline dehydrogenase-like flavoprotein